MTTKKTRGTARRAHARAIPSIAPLARDTAADAALPYSVVYIHGIGQQEPPEVCKRNWDTALFGQSMSDTTMAYWADIRHPPAAGLGARARPVSRPATLSAAARRFSESLRESMIERAGIAMTTRSGSVNAKVFALFPGIGDALFKWLTNGFIKDTAAYFYDETQKAAMQQRLIDALEERADKPIVLIAHSQGTIISYDVLRLLNGVTPAGRRLEIPLFVTIGSPLGVDEIQRKLIRPLAVPSGVKSWVNFADRFDPVALDKGLNAEFDGIPIRDRIVRNPILGNPHSAVGYLSTPEVRSTVYSVLNWNQLRYGSRVRKDVLADLIQSIAARELEDSGVREDRHPVLIELRDPAGFGESAAAGLKKNTQLASLSTHRQFVVDYLRTHVADVDDACIDPLQRFVAANLTPSEVQATEIDCLTKVYCVWKNARKRALIARSGNVVQVPAARAAYQADGKGIAWAVFDTGVDSSHPHFAENGNIVAVWDCTKPGPPKAIRSDRSPSKDIEGHGTHVCGIIAGEHHEYRGMAPRAKLHVYKVLDDAGSGNDSWIIKAIEHVTALNNDAAELVVHGVNLSLGGGFDAEVYGCGHSPICQELGRLWRQGLVVCVACGNEGALDISTPDGTQTINPMLSIGDPANLDDCIAVGSVHADRPHSYGISYFSSRGPTADGRPKPDVVAPGERITSCNAHYTTGKETSYYVSLSGTSMSAPHVSGLVAAFLSVRREFVGRPDDVKRILIGNCTDLGRDRYLQGAGMPNLVKMLANT